jgi:hypothetical protein
MSGPYCADGAEVALGTALPNARLAVVDAHDQLLPVGVPGELLISGDGVALGYLNRPELSSERFVERDIGGTGLARWYRSGDLVRVRDDGNLYYVGRKDTQVKVRGYRIELGEIESVLARHSGIQEAVVIVREDRPSDRRLVAYIVSSQQGQPLSEALLRKYVRAELPEYMVPQHFVTLDRLPLSSSGKIDRRRLPAPTASKDAGAEHVEPSTEIEQFLAETWQQILELKRVSASDNFFELGGHSLLCLQVTARVEGKYGVHVNPRIILRNSLAQVAQHIQEAVSAGEDTTAATVVSVQAAASKRTGLMERLFGRPSR